LRDHVHDLHHELVKANLLLLLHLMATNIFHVVYVLPSLVQQEDYDSLPSSAAAPGRADFPVCSLRGHG
jgi:hypothetical protein